MIRNPVCRMKPPSSRYLDDLDSARYEAVRIKRSERRRKPSAPFITSTLQQEASRRLGYTARRTMALAQQLYEGIDVGEGGATGLITYMRTDSTNISDLAINEVRPFIENTYGKDYLPPSALSYKTRAVSAQEAHETIRPTSVLRTPEKVKSALSPEQFKLYTLIWQRFVACQMESAVYDTLSVEITAKTANHSYLFRASGSTLKFPGFLVVYEETRDEDRKINEEEESLNVRIPANISEGQTPGTGPPGSRAAFHPTAAALQRGLAGAVAGRIWYRPAFDLCPDPFHHPGTRLCGPREAISTRLTARQTESLAEATKRLAELTEDEVQLSRAALQATIRPRMIDVPFGLGACAAARPSEHRRLCPRPRGNHDKYGPRRRDAIQHSESKRWPRNRPCSRQRDDALARPDRATRPRHVLRATNRRSGSTGRDDSRRLHIPTERSRTPEPRQRPRGILGSTFLTRTSPTNSPK